MEPHVTANTNSRVHSAGSGRGQELPLPGRQPGAIKDSAAPSGSGRFCSPSVDATGIRYRPWTEQTCTWHEALVGH
ncbi:hypothetical protein EYF80_039636 [Liparis tanakae]|uniref:Uncharacterized protein n=1 Tax=Liparis tanakae TaxID=230148 RepID=A0A4Z2G9C1_9TELE|nr:hypothetical protein EYF80_039636 [Liparis tanakae]